MILCALLAISLSSPHLGRFFELDDWVPPSVESERTYGSPDATNATHRIDPTAIAAVNAIFEGWCERCYYFNEGESNVWDEADYGPTCRGSDKSGFRFGLPGTVSHPAPDFVYDPDTNRTVETRRFVEYLNVADLADALCHYGWQVGDNEVDIGAAVELFRPGWGVENAPAGAEPGWSVLADPLVSSTLFDALRPYDDVIPKLPEFDWHDWDSTGMTTSHWNVAMLSWRNTSKDYPYGEFRWTNSYFDDPKYYGSRISTIQNMVDWLNWGEPPFDRSQLDDLVPDNLVLKETTENVISNAYPGVVTWKEKRTKPLYFSADEKIVYPTAETVGSDYLQTLFMYSVLSDGNNDAIVRHLEPFLTSGFVQGTAVILLEMDDYPWPDPNTGWWTEHPVYDQSFTYQLSYVNVYDPTGGVLNLYVSQQPQWSMFDRFLVNSSEVPFYPEPGFTYDYFGVESVDRDDFGKEGPTIRVACDVNLSVFVPGSYMLYPSNFRLLDDKNGDGRVHYANLSWEAECTDTVFKAHGIYTNSTRRLVTDQVAGIGQCLGALDRTYSDAYRGATVLTTNVSWEASMEFRSATNSYSTYDGPDADGMFFFWDYDDDRGEFIAHTAEEHCEFNYFRCGDPSIRQEVSQIPVVTNYHGRLNQVQFKVNPSEAVLNETGPVIAEPMTEGRAVRLSEFARVTADLPDNTDYRFEGGVSLEYGRFYCDAMATLRYYDHEMGYFVDTVITNIQVHLPDRLDIYVVGGMTGHYGYSEDLYADVTNVVSGFRHPGSFDRVMRSDLWALMSAAAEKGSIGYPVRDWAEYPITAAGYGNYNVKYASYVDQFSSEGGFDEVYRYDYLRLGSETRGLLDDMLGFDHRDFRRAFDRLSITMSDMLGDAVYAIGSNSEYYDYERGTRTIAKFGIQTAGLPLCVIDDNFNIIEPGNPDDKFRKRDGVLYARFERLGGGHIDVDVNDIGDFPYFWILFGPGAVAGEWIKNPDARKTGQYGAAATGKMATVSRVDWNFNALKREDKKGDNNQ